MNIINWNRVYETNKELDSVFYHKYGNDESIYAKNCLEILVELGEFLNETKVFKYWSIKKADKNKVLMEYADVITMCLYFYREFKLEIDDRYLHIESRNVLEVINYLYQKMSLLMNNKNGDLIKDIFDNILYVGELLNLQEEEIINAIDEKQRIIRERLSSNY